MRQPSVMYIDFEIQNDVFNDRSRVHMGVNNIATQFTTNLNGSGIVIAVARFWPDDDHGDFGNRIVSNTDVIGDGSTADAHSGHGTHVACTVLGDGTRGGYAGVAPQADLIFQAMERDSDGQFLSPSLNYIMNQAYSLTEQEFIQIHGVHPPLLTLESTPLNQKMLMTVLTLTIDIPVAMKV